jgi:hypothetical protein
MDNGMTLGVVPGVEWLDDGEANTGQAVRRARTARDRFQA